MRYLVVHNTHITQHFSLSGLNIKPLLEKRVNMHNIVVIDESFNYDITYTFPEYIFEVNKIMNSYSRSVVEQVFKLNADFIYNKPIQENFLHDLIIVLRKSKYKKINIPHIDRSGKIRLTLAQNSSNTIKSIKIKNNVEAYLKLRSIIFNTTVLPYVKMLLFGGI